jgi:hypothetical protein
MGGIVTGFLQPLFYFTVGAGLLITSLRPPSFSINTEMQLPQKRV